MDIYSYSTRCRSQIRIFAYLHFKSPLVNEHVKCIHLEPLTTF